MTTKAGTARHLIFIGICAAICGAALYNALLVPPQMRIAWRAGYAAGVADYQKISCHGAPVCFWEIPEPPAEYGGIDAPRK